MRSMSSRTSAAPASSSTPSIAAAPDPHPLYSRCHQRSSSSNPPQRSSSIDPHHHSGPRQDSHRTDHKISPSDRLKTCYHSFGAYLVGARTFRDCTSPLRTRSLGPSRWRAAASAHPARAMRPCRRAHAWWMLSLRGCRIVGIGRFLDRTPCRRRRTATRSCCLSGPVWLLPSRAKGRRTTEAGSEQLGRAGGFWNLMQPDRGSR